MVAIVENNEHLTRNEKLRQHGEGRMQAAMAKKRRHSRAEIATKLAQANELATRGKLQIEIARTLGVLGECAHGPPAGSVHFLPPLIETTCRSRCKRPFPLL